jgi:hypothetical protein
MGTTADAVTGTMQNHGVTYVQYNHSITHLKQTTAVVGVMVNLRTVTTVVTSSTQSISAGVLLDLSHNNGNLVFLTKVGSPKGAKPRGS